MRRFENARGLILFAGAALLLGLGGCATTHVVDTASEEQGRAQRDLGADHLANGRTALAIRSLQHSAALDPTNGLTQMWLGEALRRRGHLDSAREAAERAIVLSPASHVAKLSLSALMLQMEDYEEAIVLLDELIEDPTYPAPWQALSNRGWAHLKRRQLEPARKDFVEALDFHPKYWPARLNLGIVAKAEGNLLEAMQHLTQVAEKSHSDGAKAEANYRIAEILVSLGQRGRAVEHLRVAMEQTPTGTWGRQSRQYLTLLQGG